MAHDLTRHGSSAAGEAYARVIAAGLNRNETDIVGLYEWFTARSPGLSLYMTDVKPPENYVAAYVVALTGEPGSMFVWLLQSPSGFIAHALETRLTTSDPKSADAGVRQAPKVNWIVAELNGNADDGDEIAIYSSRPETDYRAGFPAVYNLSSLPARKLPFLPPQSGFSMGADFSSYWSLERPASGPNRLVFRGEAFPTCPTTVEQAYTWNDKYFEASKPTFSIKPNIPTLAHCGAVIDHAAAHWGPEAATKFMEAVSDQWPPPADITGDPFPPDALDEFRFRMGVYKALTGDDQAAISLMNQVSTQPTISTSAWTTPAQRFLGAYQSPDDLYRACVLVEACDPAEAIRRMTRALAPGSDVFEQLKQRGVSPTASGFFDFDGDDQAERWFTTRYRERYKNEFWILAEDELGVQAIQVMTVESIPPSLTVLEEDYIAEESLDLQPAAFLDNAYAFTMERLPDTGVAYLVPVPLRAEYPSKFILPLQAAREALLNGGDADEIQTDLENLADFPGLLCRATWTCDEYYYYLGLAAELNGDERAAVEAYHRLWLDYANSPFTTLARLKLSGEPVATAAPLPSATAIPVTPATPSASATGPTPTGPTPTAPTPTGPTPTETSNGGTPTTTTTPTQTQEYPYYPYYP